MALPLRRVVIGLAIRLNRRHEEIERWPMEVLREYMVMLREINAPSKPEARTPQTDEDIKNAMSHLRDFKGD